MKKSLYIMMICAMALAVASCGKSEDEMVPLSESTSSTKTYKLPDPTLLNSQESAIVDEIRAEYRNNVK